MELKRVCKIVLVYALKHKKMKDRKLGFSLTLEQ